MISYDRFRSSVVNEPRGSDVLVGALLCEPELDPDNIAGTIFFNNVGYLGMCGHGSIGLAVTLAHLGRMETGEHQTGNAGRETFLLQLHDKNRASVSNVASYRYKRTTFVCRSRKLAKCAATSRGAATGFISYPTHGPVA